MTADMTFTAVAEARPGPKWCARWTLSWPAYRAWFEARGGREGPDRAECVAALARYMPELVPVHRRLAMLAGGDDLAARFLSTWCPPPYLGGCSVAAIPSDGAATLVRNYDLSPDLNEGLLLRTEWTGTPVMGMTEFLWGLSDGINAHGLSVALAFGGTHATGRGFGICTILRYVLETCRSVAEARAVLARVPSHMDYNLVLADAAGETASVEMHAGGGCTARAPSIATNHQLSAPLPDKASFTRTVERRACLSRLVSGAGPLEDKLGAFLAPPLYQTDFAGGFGTLFTAVYAPREARMRLLWPDAEMCQNLSDFKETTRHVQLAPAPRDASGAETSAPGFAELLRHVPPRNRPAARNWLDRAERGQIDWVAFGMLFAA
ncbi:Acyl-coenzyme A:6-aminopenicillanic acid acyl-transferase [Roseivivax jejudonensis]|uniref:Acyl-coenzyme A:6-aminopenicillanic acid acyl-transferase n=1 Tax=Roseivivax jejudonensis TaxID=1529041 RepID=A0A1X6ZZ25_9RHOB|nr:C45 family peptidase [Roseivivax jejudonensis]SLN65824.1 Acyl-coenzyme A:6-aminopenicillanic acid acyl-transferase [Roseivivax jejudonensis]